MLLSSEILGLNIACSFWNMLFQGSMMEKMASEIIPGVDLL